MFQVFGENFQLQCSPLSSGYPAFAEAEHFPAGEEHTPDKRYLAIYPVFIRKA
jgi:hypothetical protein